ncbi:cupredoxin domain-containing protein [Rhodococcus chondri]|uniref:Cupredoxin domain-containing protein n=1 Tax=Rhodococcus chondri TaxID=3065941 RepID=A0ABU7JX31_9NOCA|nr:cupredoxin domain-containing protein [Rhodococcus sp. CC-R104]MEE2034562.1 cupredoxin domain-containing protein [Rhodococcus sp. CC-R104]
MKRAALLVVTLLIAAFVLTACGSETESPTVTASPDAGNGSAEAVTIVIKDYRFEVPDSVGPGTMVTVRNDDQVEHSVTARDKAFDVEVHAGETVTFTAPSDARTYDIFCTYHPEMTGQLTVA